MHLIMMRSWFIVAMLMSSTVIADDDLAATLDQYLTSLAETDQFSGSVLVAVDHKTVFSAGYGLANRELGVENTPRTKFRIGSVTKQFTSMAILILREQGRIELHNAVGDYWPDAPELWKPLKLRHLLNHTSGISHSWSLPSFSDTMILPRSLEEVLSSFYDVPLLSDPGEEFHYSGVAYFLLAKLIEEVSGTSYHQFLDENIFALIGMNNSGGDEQRSIIQNRASGYWALEDELVNAPPIHIQILTGGGDLYSTVDDLKNWTDALDDGKFISTESYKEMFTPGLNDYGYGWSIIDYDGHQMMRHSGGVPGFSAQIARVPKQRIAVVLLCNNRESESGAIIDHILDTVLETQL